MKHVVDSLPEYLSNDLTPEEAREVEAHLTSCASCRAELRRLHETFAAMVEGLPQRDTDTSSAAAWDGVQKRIRKPYVFHALWQPLVVAASLLLVFASVWWSVSKQQNLLQTQAEQQLVSRWLARQDVRVYALPPQGEKLLGSVLVLPNGRALFVLAQPLSTDKTYQAWGHRGGKQTSLGVFKTTVFEVSYSGFETVGVSLEPTGGSVQPTQPLGKIPLG